MGQRSSVLPRRRPGGRGAAWDFAPRWRRRTGETVTLRTRTEETPGATTTLTRPHGTRPAPWPPRPSPHRRPTATR